AAVRFAGAFIFKYSPRPNTESGAWEDSVPDAVKTERLMILQRRQQEIQREDNQALVGRRLEVMVEAYNPKLGQWIGRATTNRTVNFTLAPGRGAAALPPVLDQPEALPPAPFRPGDYTWVEVAKAGANSLVGIQVEGAA
ncbi:MAG: hypothetical protein ACRD13_05020, partial [Terriglobales bacterium]